MIKLFVGGFPLDIEEIELAKHFGPHGDICSIKIVRDKKPQICKGYAFIEMADRAGAANTQEALNGTMLNGKTLTVNINDDLIAENQPIQTITRSTKTTDNPNADTLNAEIKKKRPRLVKV